MISPTTTPPTTGPDHLASARLAGIEIASITAPSNLAAVHRNLLHRGSAAEGEDQDRHITAALTVYMTHSSWTYRTHHPQALHAAHQVLHSLADYLSATERAESMRAEQRARGWSNQMQILEPDSNHRSTSFRLPGSTPAQPAPDSARPRRRWFR
ncbi:hypothetical protein [Pseudonocardia alni]|uniref:hypothetical protein n=1 Tax=Pseudonocardia alni TaxID=33907 RepID=UPI00280AD543|nr:hypothetical protein [Pseudonocardia alni]